MTRNRLTVEELAKDTLDVRELNRAAETPNETQLGSCTRCVLAMGCVVEIHR